MKMRSRILMSASASFLAVAGVATTFLPQELLAGAGAPPTPTSVLLVQVIGALYLGMAALNWMNRGNRIGGIYLRPVSMANFVNFAIGAVTLLKWHLAQGFSLHFTVLALIYAVFAVWFGWVLFRGPFDEVRAG